jgi:hypothetical protein
VVSSPGRCVLRCALTPQGRQQALQGRASQQDSRAGQAAARCLLQPVVPQQHALPVEQQLRMAP